MNFRLFLLLASTLLVPACASAGHSGTRSDCLKTSDVATLLRDFGDRGWQNMAPELLVSYTLPGTARPKWPPQEQAQPGAPPGSYRLFIAGMPKAETEPECSVAFVFGGERGDKFIELHVAFQEKQRARAQELAQMWESALQLPPAAADSMITSGCAEISSECTRSYEWSISSAERESVRLQVYPSESVWEVRLDLGIH
jgi:hypothetical protein